MREAEEHKGEVNIQIGSKMYIMRFDANALANLSKLSGETLGIESLKNMDEGYIRNAIYCGIKKQHKTITLEGIGAMMSLSQKWLAYYLSRITKARKLAEAKDTTNPPPIEQGIFPEEAEKVLKDEGIIIGTTSNEQP